MSSNSFDDARHSGARREIRRFEKRNTVTLAESPNVSPGFASGITIALSPCPNDTFLFDAWHNSDHPPHLYFHDIEQLNRYALEGKYDITKISAALLPKITNQYQLLPVGAAFGFSFGPKIISKTKRPIEEMHIASPGEYTSAYATMNHFFRPKKVTHMAYHTIVPAILSGQVDGGLIIHETRFTFSLSGLIECVDLGKLYYDTYKLPLPLGLFVAKKNLSLDLIETFCSKLRWSIEEGRKSSTISPFIKEHSQEKSDIVIRQHIDLYVSDETHTLSPLGKSAYSFLMPGTR